MDQTLSILEHLKDILVSMKEQQTTILSYMDKQTSMNERQTGLLSSMNQHLAKLNGSNLQNKFEDEDHIHMEKGKGEQKVTKKEEQLDESPAPCPSSSSPYYRLEIEGVVGVEDRTQGTPDTDTRGKHRTSHTLIAGKPLNIRVILKKDDDKVPNDDPLAKVRLQLVVLDEDFNIPYSDEHNSRPSWPQEDFTKHCMHLMNQGVPRRKNLVVDKDEIRLNAGRGAPHEAATIKLNSQKKPVKLGAMIHPNDQISYPRVLEGVSNTFLVKDPPRVKKEKTNQGVTTTSESLPAKDMPASSSLGASSYG